MKVAYFSNHFVESNGHGIARYTKKVFEGIHGLDSGITLIPISSLSRSRIHDFCRLKENTGLKLLPWGRYPTALAWGFLRRPNLEYWVGNDFDLVHAPNLGYPVPTKKPYIVTIHDVGPLTRPEFFSKRSITWMRLGLDSAIKKASNIICVSRATADEVILIGGKELANRIHVIHEGVEPLFHKHPDLSCLDAVKGMPPKGTPFCLAAGAISPRKNIMRIVLAMEKLADELPLHHLCLVGGGGWDNEEVFDLVKNSPIASRIHHLGYVTDEQLHALYSMAEVFIYPSLFEGFGLPVIEAMASGCPVITSNNSSLPEIAGHAAIFVDPHNVSSIAKAILRVCSDGALREELSALGLERSKVFCWEKCARQVADVYSMSV